MYETIETFDLETGTHSADKRKATRWHPENYIVAAGWKSGDNQTEGSYHEKAERIPVPKRLAQAKLLVGFNIKFDLLWMWEYEEIQDFFKRGGVIWDCQYVEYLLEGHQQHAQMASMNSIIEKYGGTLKMDAVKVMWEEGIDTPDIPQDILMKYLLGDPEEDIQGDVNNTFLIMMGQMKRIREEFPKETMQMIKNRMDGLLATTEMEYNGLKLDLELGMQMQKEQADALVKLDQNLLKFLPEFPPEFEFKWTSNHHRSCLIYGGTAKYLKWVQHEDEEGNKLYANKVEKWPLVDGTPTHPDLLGDLTQDTFKSGKRIGEGKTKNVTVPDLTKPKGAKQEHYIRFKGYTQPDQKWKSTLVDAKGLNIYSTAANIIEELAVRNIPFLKMLAQRQKMQKDLGTYFWMEDKNGQRKGMLTLVNEQDGLIHHKLNHTSTVTSRLSSSDPNMQNIPKADKSVVKKLFISRYGDDGEMAEIDYSQLEVVVQGILSHDPQLIKDLQNRIDFHCKRLGIKLGESYEEVVHKVKVLLDEVYIQQRSDIKSFTFERAYGAAAYSISANNDIPLDEVEELIRIEETMYPGVVAFDRLVEAAIRSSRWETSTELYIRGKRVSIGKGEWFSPTGTRYVWTEGETPEFIQKRGKLVGFSPTERKNWPIQGTGGEIVQTMLGCLWRWLIANDRFDNKAWLCNTVHDCVWLDMHKSVTNKVVPTACKILEAVPHKFNKDFDMDITVPFPVEAEVGPNMYDLQHYTG